MGRGGESSLKGGGARPGLPRIFVSAKFHVFALGPFWCPRWPFDAVSRHSGRVSKGDESLSEAFAHQVDAVAGAELAHQIALVSVDRPGIDLEQNSDLLHGIALEVEGEDLALAPA